MCPTGFSIYLILQFNGKHIFLFNTIFFGVQLSVGEWINTFKLFYPQKSFPKFLSKAYSQEKYKKSQEYERAKLRLGILVSVIHFIAVFAFFYFGGFAFLDTFVRNQTDNYLFQNLMFFGLLAFVSDFLSLPV